MGQRVVVQGTLPYSTALSMHEISQGYQTVTEPSVYVKFMTKDVCLFSGTFNVYCIEVLLGKRLYWGFLWLGDMELVR